MNKNYLQFSFCLVDIIFNSALATVYVDNSALFIVEL